MKTNRMKIFVSALAIMFAFACEQDELTDDDHDWAYGDFPKSGVEDTLTIVPDIVVEDTVLLKHATVSQYRENYITYAYDRYGRLYNINYFRRNNAITTDAEDVAPDYVYMRDRFIYNNAGRLAEILRYNRTDSPQLTNVLIRKSYKYDAGGRLSVIVTSWPNAAADMERIEYLYYDDMGFMVRKVIKEPNGFPYFFSYKYDRSGKLIRITGYRGESNALQFVCFLYYDNRNNIERKTFYYPSPIASSTDDVVRKWVVHYKYDNARNPFRDFRLPVSSLFEWMDVISPNNIAAIVFDNGTSERAVFYKYRYNNIGYPILRVRVNGLPYTDAIE